MNYIKNINLKTNDLYNIIIEIPKGTSNKYELTAPANEKIECVRKVKGKYPFYYGCFPQTHAQDNDPLDMILLTNKKRNILDVVEALPIGVIKTIDDGEQDDKVLMVDYYEVLPNINKMKKQAIKFLKKYKGRKSKMILDTKIYDANTAIDIINDCHNTYKNLFTKSNVKIRF